MSEYTPTTEEVRGAYHAWSDGQGDNFDEKPTWSFPEFDRWFASEIAKAERRAWTVGARDMMEAIADDHGTLSFIAPLNPYERPTKSVRQVIEENGGTSPTVEAWA